MQSSDNDAINMKMSEQRNSSIFQIYMMIGGHVVLPIAAYVAGRVAFSSIPSIAHKLESLVNSIPLLNLHRVMVSERLGGEAADRFVVVSAVMIFAAMLFFLLCAIAGLRSAFMVRQGVMRDPKGKTLQYILIVLIGIFALSRFRSPYPISDATRILRVMNNSDFKFLVYSCTAIPIGWAVLIIFRAVGLQLFKTPWGIKFQTKTNNKK